MLENLGEFHCTCRFYRAGEFVPAVLIPESECGYHSTMRKRCDEASGEWYAAIEAAAKLFDGCTYGPYQHPSQAIRALKRQSAPDQRPTGDEQT